MNRQELKARLNALKVQPPSAEAEDRAIRAGLDAFDRRRQTTVFRLGSPLRHWRMHHWLVAGAVTASLCATIIILAPLVIDDPNRYDLAASSADDPLPPAASVADLSGTPALSLDGALRLEVEPEIVEELIVLASTMPAQDVAADDGRKQIPGTAANSGELDPEFGSAERIAGAAPVTPEQIEEVLRIHDGALRRQFGEEIVSQLKSMAESGELRRYLRTYQAKPVFTLGHATVDGTE